MWNFFSLNIRNDICRPTFHVIRKKKSVEQFSPVPYLATFINCALWILYGLPVVHPHSLLVITINGAGFLIELVYLIMFVLYSDKKGKIKVMLIILLEFLFVSILAVLVLTLAHSTKLRSAIVGSICMVGNVMMYASPLAVMVIPSPPAPLPLSLSLSVSHHILYIYIYMLIG